MLKIIVKGCEPQLATKYSAAIDLFASEDVAIGAGETKAVALGVCIDLNFFLANNFAIDYFSKRHYLELHPRSSLRAKGLISSTEIIPLDYKDEIKIIIHNPIIHIEREIEFDKEDDYIEIDYKGTPNEEKYTCSDMYRIKKGDKIAQILLKEHKTYLMGITSNEERTGKFGSTNENN